MDDLKILVVDDGSVDRTAEIADQDAVQEDPDVVVPAEVEDHIMVGPIGAEHLSAGRNGKILDLHVHAKEKVFRVLHFHAVRKMIPG